MERASGNEGESRRAEGDLVIFLSAKTIQRDKLNPKREGPCKALKQKKSDASRVHLADPAIIIIIT